MELPDITQAIALAAKTGQLVVALPFGAAAPCSSTADGSCTRSSRADRKRPSRRCWWRRTARQNGNFAFNPLEAGGGQRREDDSPGSQAALAERRAEIDEGPRKTRPWLNLLRRTLSRGPRGRRQLEREGRSSRKRSRVVRLQVLAAASGAEAIQMIEARTGPTS